MTKNELRAMLLIVAEALNCCHTSTCLLCPMCIDDECCETDDKHVDHLAKLIAKRVKEMEPNDDEK